MTLNLGHNSLLEFSMNEKVKNSFSWRVLKICLILSAALLILLSLAEAGADMMELIVCSTM